MSPGHWRIFVCLASGLYLAEFPDSEAGTRDLRSLKLRSDWAAAATVSASASETATTVLLAFTGTPLRLLLRLRTKFGL